MLKKVEKPTPKTVPKPSPKPVDKPAPKPVSKPEPKPVTQPKHEPTHKPTGKPDDDSKGKSKPPPKSHTGTSHAGSSDAPSHKGTEPPHKPPPVEAVTASAGYTQQQLDNQKIYYEEGKRLGASKLAILAALCAGSGENSWHTNGCNSLGYCGTWQIGRNFQAEHDYHDVKYWTAYAYKNGFFGYGGIIEIANKHPDYSPGRIANMCQGAYSDLDTGARYYDGYASEAESIYTALSKDKLPTLASLGEPSIPSDPHDAAQAGDFGDEFYHAFQNLHKGTSLASKRSVAAAKFATSHTYATSKGIVK